MFLLQRTVQIVVFSVSNKSDAKFPSQVKDEEAVDSHLNDEIDTLETMIVIQNNKSSFFHIGLKDYQSHFPEWMTKLVKHGLVHFAPDDRNISSARH